MIQMYSQPVVCIHMCTHECMSVTMTMNKVRDLNLKIQIKLQTSQLNKIKWNKHTERHKTVFTHSDTHQV